MNNITLKTHVVTLKLKLPIHRNARNYEVGCEPILQNTNPHDGI